MCILILLEVYLHDKFLNLGLLSQKVSTYGQIKMYLISPDIVPWEETIIPVIPAPKMHNLNLTMKKQPLQTTNLYSSKMLMR